jgi:hypothetical protein
MRATKIILSAASALAALFLLGPAEAFAAPVLEVASSHYPASVPAGTYARYELKVSNAGDVPTSGGITAHFAVPAGLEITSVADEVEKKFGVPAWGCAIAPGAQSLSCSGPELFGPLPIEAGKEACEGAFGSVASCRILVMVRTAAGLSPGTVVAPSVEVCGGGASACANASDPIEVGPPPQFELTRFDGEVLQENGEPATQAGAHPATASTEFFISTSLGAKEMVFPVEQFQDAAVELPPGLVGNPQAIPTCTQEQLRGSGSAPTCPPDSQVGTVTPWFGTQLSFGDGGLTTGTTNVYNMQTPPGTSSTPIGTPGLFGFNYEGALIEIYAKLRTGKDYGLTLISKNAPQTLPLAGIVFDFWGVPGDPGHDVDRGFNEEGQQCSQTPSPTCRNHFSGPVKPFLSLPSSCGDPALTSLAAMGWLGGFDSASFLSHDNTEPIPNPIGNDGCNALDFSPTLQARPTTNVADAPSGLDVDLHVPQSEDPEGTAEANLKDTTVTLPEGMVVNPSGANGLGACSEAQLGFTGKEGDVIHTTPDPATCPEQAKLGTVQVDSPLLDHPLNGNAYIAQPHANPFGSLLALYITLDDPQTGTVVKLAGEIHADPNTGQLTTTVLNNPQLPFEDFKLHFFGGSGGALRTPAACGTYSTTSSLTPWSAPDSGPPATPSDPWAIAQSPSGGDCPTSNEARPNTPDLDAGSVSPIAASYSPAVVNLRRQDGSQEFSAVNLTLPPGMTGKLAGVSYCSDAALATAASKSGNQEKASPSCPATSRIGTVDVAAGAGPAPYNAQGTAYLTPPYKGAPLGMAIVTPATAGPFDLGTVVVRVALRLDPTTGQITAVSDPIPSILQGIPLDIRSASVKLDRPSFTRNGTSCNPLAFSGQLTSTLGQVAPLTERFQLGECTGLGFKPKLGIRLTGSTKRGGHPALTATLTMPEGGANLAKAVVALPHSEFLDQAHIGTVCTRVQFAANQCPAASVYGHAVATSPLVDYAVEGPVYLRSSSNKLPDLVLALKGPPSQPIEVQAIGRVDTIKGGIRTSFEGTPDLPVSSVVLSMEGGKKGLLQNSTNICKGANKATAELDGQNGKVADLAPELKNGKCKKPRKAKKPNHRHQRAVR